jgi:transcriptional regulator with XRE-family HTH domain
MDIGKRIRALREERGLTQREVARRAGLTPSGVGFIEHGQTRNPSAETVVSIARALGVPVEELLEEPVPLAKAPQETGLSEEALVQAPPGLNYEESTDYIERHRRYRDIAKGLSSFAQRKRRRLEAGEFDEEASLKELVADLEDWASSAEGNHAEERKELGERYNEQSVLRPAIEELRLLVREALGKAGAEEDRRKLVSIAGRLEAA